MTFAEYFNFLYPYLSDDENKIDFFDAMIGHFIDEDSQEACALLSCKADTKRRYIKESGSNKIKPEYAQYVHSRHNPAIYIKWLNERMYAADTYDTIEKWLTSKGIDFTDGCAACDTLLEDIIFNIAYPNVGDASEVKLPEKTVIKNPNSKQLSENDIILLKDFHADYDNILEKCVENNQSEVWFTSSLSSKINRLYTEKWKDRISKFNSLSLQSDILSTIATLQDFCNAFDPDSNSTPVTSVRRLRMKLRDNYIKIHPENYVGIFPYDAFIDDWTDENAFEF